MSTIFIIDYLKVVLLLSLFSGGSIAIAQHADGTARGPYLAYAYTGSMRAGVAQPFFSVKIGGKLALCSHSDKGEILLDVEGGNPPYTFLWNNLSTDQNRFNLNAGTYTVVVTDRAGQSHTERIVIQPPFPLIAELVHFKSPSCPNTKDGSATVNIKVGRGEPYRIEWSNGLKDALEATGLQAGTYEVKIFDKYNCQTTVAFDLVPTAAPVAIQETVQEPTCGISNGSIGLTVAGANSPYTFRWSNGATSASLSALAPGEYTVEITDKNKCIWTRSYSLATHSPMEISVLDQKLPSCGDQHDGSIEVEVAGGLPPYSFSWDNMVSGSKLESIKAGVYELKVKDNSGCELTQIFRLEPSAAPSVNLQTKMEMGCNSAEATGLAWVTIQGGTPPYQIKWNNGISGKAEIEFSNLTEVEVQVTDANGCTILRSQKISMPNTSQFRRLEVEVKKLYLGSDQAIKVNEEIYFNSNEKRNIIAMEWDFGDGIRSSEESPVHRYTNPGVYTVVLKAFDFAACMQTSSLEVTVTEKKDWVVMPNAFSPNGDGLNDFFQPVLFGVTQFQLDIFNQWGEHLFTDSRLETKGWDGYYKGVISPKGNYVYRISFTTNTGEYHQKSGYLALIR
jgi:gliding motility-associated-like protein